MADNLYRGQGAFGDPGRPYNIGPQSSSNRPVYKAAAMQGIPQFPQQCWPRGNGQLPRFWSPGLGSMAAATSYGWPYENWTAIVPIPRVRDVNAALMQRGSLAALSRPGGGGMDWAGTTYIPATPSRTNYSRP